MAEYRGDPDPGDPDPGDPTDLETLQTLIAAFAPYFDQHPNDLTLLRDVVLEHLNSEPQLDSTESAELQTRHLANIYPGVLADPRIQDLRARMVDALTDPSGGTTEGVPAAPVVIGGGLVILGAAAVAYLYYK
jgi:hypothetical protein